MPVFTVYMTPTGKNIKSYKRQLRGGLSTYTWLDRSYLKTKGRRYLSLLKETSCSWLTDIKTMGCFLRTSTLVATQSVKKSSKFKVVHRLFCAFAPIQAERLKGNSFELSQLITKLVRFSWSSSTLKAPQYSWSRIKPLVFSLYIQNFVNIKIKVIVVWDWYCGLDLIV